MRTMTIVVIAAMVLACGPSLARGGNKETPQEQQAHRSPEPVPKGWPEQWGQRKLHRCEHALIYAQKKSAADEAAKMLRAVVEDAKRDGVTKPAVGLIVVIDAQEKFPIEIATLTEILSDPNMPAAGEKSKEILSSIKEAKRLSDHAGADMNSLVSVVPIPIRPAALPKIAKELPEGVDREIAWCLVIPTDSYIRATWTTIMDTIVKSDEVNWKDRPAVRVGFLLTARVAGEEMRKVRQADLYQLLMDGQKGLSKDLKKKMLDAYRQKLGLGGQSKPEADQDQTPVRQEGASGSG